MRCFSSRERNAISKTPCCKICITSLKTVYFFLGSQNFRIYDTVTRAGLSNPKCCLGAIGKLGGLGCSSGSVDCPGCRPLWLILIPTKWPSNLRIAQNWIASLFILEGYANLFPKSWLINHGHPETAKCHCTQFIHILNILCLPSLSIIKTNTEENLVIKKTCGRCII